MPWYVRRVAQQNSPAFTIKKQGELDYACSLYCVLSAAIHLGAVPRNYGAANILAHRKVPRDLPRRLLTNGATESELRCLAVAAKLGMCRANLPTLDTLRDGALEHHHLWIVRVWMTFEAAEGGDQRGGDAVTTGTNLDEEHYVLVLDVTPDYVVVADPHPSHEDIYRMTIPGFERAWIRRGRRWAASLIRP